METKENYIDKAPNCAYCVLLTNDLEPREESVEVKTLVDSRSVSACYSWCIKKNAFMVVMVNFESSDNQKKENFKLPKIPPLR